jgi:GntR family transcriptional regulator
MRNQDGIAYYRQIADILIRRIHSGDYQPGEQLPSDRDLSSEFGHNRHTIRRALEIIEDQRLITRQQGRGTFVATELPSATKKIQLPIGLIDITQRLGQRPDAHLLNIQVGPFGRVSKPLRLKGADQVIYIQRLRLIDNEPAILEHIYVPHTLTPDLEQQDLSQSLRNMMAERYGLVVTCKEIEFEPILSSSYISQQLGISVGSPVIMEKRLSFANGEIPCEYSEHIYRGDRFAFTLRQ